MKHRNYYYLCIKPPRCNDSKTRYIMLKFENKHCVLFVNKEKGKNVWKCDC